MSAGMADTNSDTVSRQANATAVDFPRDYTQELEHAGSEGEYTAELGETVQALDSALRDGN